MDFITARQKNYTVQYIGTLYSILNYCSGAINDKRMDVTCQRNLEKSVAFSNETDGSSERGRGTGHGVAALSLMAIPRCLPFHPGQGSEMVKVYGGVRKKRVLGHFKTF